MFETLVSVRFSPSSDAMRCTVVRNLRRTARTYTNIKTCSPSVRPRYGFWSLNRFITYQLFFLNRRRRHFGRRSASSATDPDPFIRVYGSAAPSSLPESTEWWRRQGRELFATVQVAQAHASRGLSDHHVFIYQTNVYLFQSAGLLTKQSRG